MLSMRQQELQNSCEWRQPELLPHTKKACEGELVRNTWRRGAGQTLGAWPAAATCVGQRARSALGGQHGSQVGHKLGLPCWIQQDAAMPQLWVVHHLQH